MAKIAKIAGSAKIENLCSLGPTLLLCHFTPKEDVNGELKIRACQAG
jgi:hypothetical protein